MKKSLIDAYSWKDSVRILLERLIKEQDLPVGSLRLKPNYGNKVGEDITSYNIQICEPEYPSNSHQNEIIAKKSILNIKQKKDDLELIVGKTQFEAVKRLPCCLDVKHLKFDKTRVHIWFKKGAFEFVDCVEAILNDALFNYRTGTFGCCDRFNECSDVKKCIHENKLYSKACLYRRNIESGNIFYGRNRNVD